MAGWQVIKPFSERSQTGWEGEREDDDEKEGERERGGFVTMGLETPAGVRQQWVLWPVSSVFAFIIRAVGSLKGFK